MHAIAGINVAALAAILRPHEKLRTTASSASSTVSKRLPTKSACAGIALSVAQVRQALPGRVMQATSSPLRRHPPQIGITLVRPDLKIIHHALREQAVRLLTC
jgi:hypothetical protein